MNLENIPKAFRPNITKPYYLVRNGLLKSIIGPAAQMNGRLMDLGCGSKPYYSIFKVDEYIGVDYDSPGHPHDNENIDVYYDGKHLPFKENDFDSVFCSEVFEHIFNLEEIIKETHRVMKPGGRFLITCPFAICEHEVPNDFARYTSFALKHLLESNGFKVLSLGKSGNSVETVFQLWITYIDQHISVFFKNIPVFRSVFKVFTYTTLNLTALLLSKILPAKKDLYLNNIVLAEKKEVSI